VVNDNIFTLHTKQVDLRRDLDDVYELTRDNNNMLAAMYNHTFGNYPAGHNTSRNPYANNMDMDQVRHETPPHPGPTSPGGGTHWWLGPWGHGPTQVWGGPSIIVHTIYRVLVPF